MVRGTHYDAGASSRCKGAGDDTGTNSEGTTVDPSDEVTNQLSMYWLLGSSVLQLSVLVVALSLPSPPEKVSSSQKNLVYRTHDLGSQYTYTGYMEYPFENKQRKSCLLNLPFEVDKEEMIGVVVTNSACLKWIFHVASTTEILRNQHRWERNTSRL